MPVHSADTLWVKKLVKIALSRSVFEINAFLHFTQKLKMAAKSGRENDFWEKTGIDSRYPAGQKFCQNRCILLRFPDKRFSLFYAEIQDGRQKWQENNFWERSPVHSADTLLVKNFVEIALCCCVSEINVF